MIFTRIVRAATLAALAGLLGGCFLLGGAGPGRDINDPTSSLVFGHLDMKDAPTKLEWVSLQQVAPKGEEGFWSMDVDEGLFTNAYLPNGTYQVAKFGGSGFLSGEHEYQFPAFGANETALKIQKPGIYYAGAFKYQKVKTGFFEQGKFGIERVKTPNEAELLRRIQQMKWVKGTQWEARIRARLAELKK